MVNILDELKWRGLVAHTTDDAALHAAFDKGPVSYYTGYDPTAHSLHVGHMVQILNMRRLQLAGHRPIVLIGGATGLIGDPRPTTERSMQSADVVAQQAESIRRQFDPFLDFHGPQGAIVVNNLDWTAPISAIDFLREYGKHFRMGTMLSRDIVARRINSDEGMSFTEFSYQILQALDFRELYRSYGCTLQMGGNDQWGNMIGGAEFIRKTEQVSAHVLATTLVTKADGSKMGKSEGGALWIDPQLTSPYAFYQYWLNAADADVVHYLKLLTFRSQEQVADLQQQVVDSPFKREAQKALAQDLTSLVHGEQATAAVQLASLALFGRGDLRDLDVVTLLGAVAELPSAQGGSGAQVADMLVASGLAASRSEARRAIADGGAYVNNVKVESVDQELLSDQFLHGQCAVLRRGKKTLAVVRAGGLGL